MEIWDVYDIERIKTGKTVERGGNFDEGEYHLVVHVCIFNSEGKMLVQQRQPSKSSWPNLWDLTVGGSAIAGETSRAAAEREVSEEIGYEINLASSRPALTINYKAGFDDVYLMDADLDIDELTLQDEEVKQVKWATKEEIFAMIDQRIFIPYHKSYLQLLFDMRANIGPHRRL